jgi:iron complex transport system permease protein
METLSRSNRKKKNWTLGLTIALAIFVSVFTLFVGSSNMSLADGFAALFRQGSDTNIRIIWNIRIPRMLAAIIAGGGLAVAGAIMQTVLGNSLASPSTLGVSNAAVFGANISIIIAAGGFLSDRQQSHRLYRRHQFVCHFFGGLLILGFIHPSYLRPMPD